MSTNDIAIKISDIHVSFGNHHVLRGASGIIRRGSIVTFLGRNGCGKSTLLKTVTGNLKPQQGSIEIDGRPLSSYSSDEMARVVAFLPQFHDVPKDMTAEELVSCGRYPYQHWWSGVSTRDREVVAEVMKKTNTTHLKDRLVASLSGGELKRIEIAMVLARGTALSVFDEPEAGIDLWSFQNLIRVFEKMYEQTRGSILIISHQERILNIADTIVLLKDGRLAECGPREEVLPRLLRNIDTAPPVCSMLSDPIKEVR